MSKETWKDCVGWEGLYQVSDLGRVRTLPKIKKTTISRRPDGSVSQKVTSLTKDGITLQIGVHRLVLEAFIGPCPNGQEGCHKDGDPTNNVVYNVRWDTSYSNSQDTIKHGRTRAKPVVRSDGTVYRTVMKAAEQNNCAYQNIISVCKGRRKTTGGYGWSYKEE